MLIRIVKSLKLATVLLGALVMVWAGLALNAPTASAGTLTVTSVQLSSAVASATSVSAVVSFTTATTGTIATVDIAMPNFAGASPGVSGVSGLGAGTIASSGTGASYKVTYTVTSPASVSSSTAVSFTVTGLTNPTVGNQIITITTKTSAPATIDTRNTLVAIVANAAVSVSASVAEALTASIGGAGSYSLSVDPANTAFQLSSSYALSVASNAKNGVTTTAKILGALTGTAYGSATIPAVSGTFASPTSNASKPPVDTWGINADGSSGTWAGPTTGGITVSGLSAAGPTNALTQSHVIGVNVDYLTPADTYTGTILYVVTPNF